MAFNKRTWKGRQGVGLNKFSINGASPVTVVNQPDSITEVGDALSAGNLNDLEDRIADAFDETASQEEVTSVKNALDATNKRVENLEEKAGDYTEVQAKSVYSVPTGKAKNMVLVGVDGVSRVRNQLVKELNSTNWASNGATTTPTFSDGRATFTATSQYGRIQTNDTVSIISGHKYIIHAYLSCSVSANKVGIFVGEGLIAYYSGSGNYISALVTCSNTESAKVLVMDTRSSDFTQIVVGDIVITDLTLYFNGTIPSDADTIAEIQTNYPWLLTPSSYGTSMVKTRYEGFTSVGVNIFDEVTEEGAIDGSTGQDTPASNFIRSKNYIKLEYGVAYYFLAPSAIRVRGYDINKNFVRTVLNGYNSTVSATNLEGIFYVRFDVPSVSSYGHNIQICLDSYTYKTTYHPYSKHTLSLPTPIELGSAGSVAEEAYLNEDGVAWKTNPIGSVDLGTLNWTYDGGLFRSTSLSSLMEKPSSGSVKGNMLCKRYTTITSQEISSSSVMSIAINANGLIYVADSNYTSVSAFVTGISGEMLSYELATPDADTPLTVLTDNLISTEGGGTLEAVKTYPIDDSFTVGYLTL